VGRAVELGVELTEKPERPVHVRLIKDLHRNARSGAILLNLARGQSPCQLSGDGAGAGEEEIRRSRVVVPDSPTHLSEKLIQVLAEGAQAPADGLLLPVASRGPRAAVAGVDEDPTRTARPAHHGHRGRSRGGRPKDCGRRETRRVHVRAGALKRGGDGQAG
jgi:hypothetical protein